MTLTRKDGEQLLMYAGKCLRDGDLEGAQAAASLACAAAPALAEAWIALGVARARYGDHAGAVQPFIKALALRPRDVQLWCDLGECYLTLMKYPEAAAALKQAMLLDPNLEHPAGRRARAVAAKTMAQLRK